ncbi:MAG: glycoside hydrolase family 3 C-terminal domain-containing protein [Candidatus Lokiarchaeota archaeon]|nr:glycoside hydrolase family 3 C-terminal domain-containing protein [Candidatus Lokiarchaeota archaeon]
MAGKGESDGGTGAPFPHMDPRVLLETRVSDLLNQLTLDEKIDLLSGATSWSTHEIPRLGVKPMFMTDGPQGIGPHSSNNSVCTYFPTGTCRAATWNPALMRQFGAALAEEVLDIGYQMILGPAVNIIRTPFCGRNFEYQTEDPYLNARMAVPAVQAIQGKRVSSCVKHYACNNQEVWRNWVDARVSERALHEIYLPAFEAAAKEADAWSFMACYNRINGKWGCEQEHVVRELLMNKWKCRGFLVSDWGATNFIESPGGCIRAGLSLEMPATNRYKNEWLKKELDAGNCTVAQLDDNVRRLLRVMFLVGLFDDPASLPKGRRNTPEHQAAARRIAEEGIVLLKNDGAALPIDASKVRRVAVVGMNADVKMGEGGGSSQVRCPYEVTPLEGIKERCKGKIEVTDDPAGADVAVVVTGLNHKGLGESEGGDRTEFDLPGDQVDLIARTAAKNPRTVVVLVSGTPAGVESWVGSVPAVVQAWYAGQEAGHALAAVLFGDVNPSGRLPFTVPKRLGDSPAHASVETYPGIDDEDAGPTVRYAEGIYVGYRHFDKRGIEPRFPFGHGLSYTTFEWKNLRAEPATLLRGRQVSALVDVTNTGTCPGADVIQIYVEDVESSVDRPPRELKGFEKVFLGPGETLTIKVALDARALSFFDEGRGEWVAEPGVFKLHAGRSSRDIKLTTELRLEG